MELSNYEQQSDSVSVSKLNQLSLQEYCQARKVYCSLYHNRSLCPDCTNTIKAAEIILEAGICTMSSVFRTVFPEVTYHTPYAKRRLLQMPVVAIRIQEPSSGRAEVHVMELMSGVDYLKLGHFLNACASKKSTPTPSLSKVELKQLLHLAQNDKERELVRYTVFRSSGLTESGARKYYGFENLSKCIVRVEESLKEVARIRECIDSLSKVQENAVLQSMGINPSSESSEGCSDSDEGEDKENIDQFADLVPLPAIEELLHLLKLSRYNWFELVDRIIEQKDNREEAIRNPNCEEATIIQLEKIFPIVMASDLSDNEKQLIEQSHRAFNLDYHNSHSGEREANALNGLVVTDSESDDPDVYLEIHDLSGAKAQALITKKRKSIRRRARYLKSKHIAERNFLARKVSHQVRGILKDCPNIGQEIEKFVEEANVGADAWRRTGVLTFDGNTRVKSKVTYEKIRQHLMKIYQRNFSFGTVVQLCIARNKRRLSAARYKGVAQVTSRRARKGFMLKFNPDAHWSSALYRSLNHLQYQDGRNILNVNRDDAAGFRLDTMTTHRLHRTPMVQDSLAKTTYTDYVSKYKAVLQTTSYNFTGTKTTEEICAGVVKPTGVFPKNPAQHSADFELLEQTTEVGPTFINPITGTIYTSHPMHPPTLHPPNSRVYMA